MASHNKLLLLFFKNKERWSESFHIFVSTFKQYFAGCFQLYNDVYHLFLLCNFVTVIKFQFSLCAGKQHIWPRHLFLQVINFTMCAWWYLFCLKVHKGFKQFSIHFASSVLLLYVHKSQTERSKTERAQNNCSRSENEELHKLVNFGAIYEHSKLSTCGFKVIQMLVKDRS